MTDAERAALDPNSHEYHLRVEGSKTQLFGWLVYTVMLWVLKLCWLFFFKRLGDGVGNMSLRINIGFAFIGVTFFATFFAILFGCYPVEKHWQIYPDPGSASPLPPSPPPLFPLAPSANPPDSPSQQTSATPPYRGSKRSS